MIIFFSGDRQSPHPSPSKGKSNHHSSSINTKSLDSGVHAPVNPHPQSHHPVAPHLTHLPPGGHRDNDMVHSQPHLPPRRVPPAHSHYDPSMYRERLDSSNSNWSTPANSSLELNNYHGNPNSFHGNHRQQAPPRTDRQNWNISGNGGGYYASHV